MKKALVLIDMQKDFITGSLGTKEAEAILPRAVEAAERALVEGAELFFTMDTHGEDYLTTPEGKKLPLPHCIKGTAGWEIAEALLPYKAKAKAVLEKPTFGSLELPKVLAGYEEITLLGLCTDICVVSNALILKAALPEATLRVQASACAATTPEAHAAALTVLRSCQVETLDSSKIG